MVWLALFVVVFVIYLIAKSGSSGRSGTTPPPPQQRSRPHAPNTFKPTPRDNRDNGISFSEETSGAVPNTGEPAIDFVTGAKLDPNAALYRCKSCAVCVLRIEGLLLSTTRTDWMRF
jgi:hypothetical protein